MRPLSLSLVVVVEQVRPDWTGPLIKACCFFDTLKRQVIGCWDDIITHSQEALRNLYKLYKVSLVLLRLYV